jgi:pimeloyl-ACP methyl ester carboxylesterase
MRKTSTPVMQKRMQAVLSVDYSNKLKHITVPVLYLRAKHDHLVSSQACAILKNALPALKCREFDAPHFLLQVRPQEAAFAISDFLDHCVVSPA